MGGVSSNGAGSLGASSPEAAGGAVLSPPPTTGTAGFGRDPLGELGGLSGSGGTLGRPLDGGLGGPLGGGPLGGGPLGGGLGGAPGGGPGGGLQSLFGLFGGGDALTDTFGDPRERPRASNEPEADRPRDTPDPAAREGTDGALKEAAEWNDRVANAETDPETKAFIEGQSDWPGFVANRAKSIQALDEHLVETVGLMADVSQAKDQLDRIGPVGPGDPGFEAVKAIRAGIAERQGRLDRMLERTDALVAVRNTYMMTPIMEAAPQTASVGLKSDNPVAGIAGDALELGALAVGGPAGRGASSVRSGIAAAAGKGAQRTATRFAGAAALAGDMRDAYRTGILSEVRGAALDPGDPKALSKHLFANPDIGHRAQARAAITGLLKLSSGKAAKSLATRIANKHGLGDGANTVVERTVAATLEKGGRIATEARPQQH